jgi:succinylglutamic semialdehyde dehydrogenase
VRTSKGDFIGGRFVRPRGGHVLVSEDPGDLGRPVGEVRFSEASAAEAARAARAAFPKWSALPLKCRAAYLGRFGAALRRRGAALAELVTREMGKSLVESRAEIERVLVKIKIALRYETALVREVRHEAGPGLRGVLTFRPRGVVAVLSPFNVPVHLLASQAISALLTGNTVVAKPSEITPFTGEAVAGLFHEAGLPPGVFNLVQGDGRTGRALVEDPRVDAIFFTGSWETGMRIQAALAAEPRKLCALEMGGKNAAIVCDDADLPNAVAEACTGAFLTTGQRCNATSRILVHRRAAARFLKGFLERADALRIGYGTEPGVFLGPMASKKGFDRVLHFTARAGSEGFEALRKPGEWAGGRRGYYLRPSVHLREGAPPFGLKDGSYADDEVLGPDTAVYVVQSLEEAIALSNRPRYGLVTSVFTRSRKRFEEVFRRAESGVVHWNVATVRSSSRLPFGGLKRSGNHRPAGFFTPYLATIPTATIERVR